jgi:hypothetical protein
MSRFDSRLFLLLVTLVFGSWRCAHAQLPTVPGFEVSVYAPVTDPICLSFDGVTGALYVGTPGSVIVGGVVGGQDQLVAVRPDQTVEVIVRYRAR